MMRGVWTIARLTMAEASRRRILIAGLVCGAAFLVLYGVGFYFIQRESMKGNGMSGMERRMMLTMLTMAGLYAVKFLTVMTAVLMPVDTLSGEIGSGVMQTLVSKPIRRSAILLGKWLAFGAIVTGYLALMAGGVLLIARVIGGFMPPHVGVAMPVLWLGAIVLMTLSIAGGTRFTTIANGMLVFGLYGLAFIGSWVETIGSFAGNRTATTIGTAASLLMPGEAMWQLAAWHLQPPIMRDLHMTPFSTGSVPSPAMVWWAAGYVIVTLLVALRQFAKREL